MKKLLVLLGVFCLAALLSGCGKITPERRVLNVCMAVDVAQDGQLLLSVQTPKSGAAGEQSTGSAAGGTSDYLILSATGPDLTTALRTLSQSVPYPMSFSQLRLCAISMEVASRGDLIALLASIAQFPDMRPTAVVACTEGNAQELLKQQKPDFGTRLSIHLDDLQRHLQSMKLVPKSELSEIFRLLGSAREDPLICLGAVNPVAKPKEEEGKKEEEQGKQESGGESGSSVGVFSQQDTVAGMLPRQSDNPVEFLGSALTANGAVVGILSAEETKLALALREKATLRCAINGDALQLQIELPQEMHGPEVVTRVYELVSKLQALDSDALGFGRVASMAFWTDGEWESYNFGLRFPTADVFVKP